MKPTNLKRTNTALPVPANAPETIVIPDLDVAVWEQGCNMIARYGERETGFVFKATITAVSPIKENDRLIGLKVTWRTEPSNRESVMFYELSKTYSVGTTVIAEDHVGQLIEQLFGPDALQPGFDLSCLLKRKCILVVSDNLVVKRMLTSRKLEQTAKREREVVMVLPLRSRGQTKPLTKSTFGSGQRK